MNLVLWLMAGALATLLTNFRVREVPRQRLVSDLVFSELGALIAGAAAVPSTLWLALDLDLQGLVASALGAAAMLAIAHLHDIRDRSS